MKKFLVLISLALASAPAYALDHRSQYGVGGALGGTFAAPWASSTFRNSVGAHLPSVSVWGRYIPGTPEVGLELSYNYFDLSQQKIQTNAVIFAFISRQNPWGWFHPFYGLGIGYSQSSNWYTTGNWDAPIFKILVGIEFELNERTDVGFHLDHYTIFKNQPTEPNLHVLAPMLTLTYYLGSPAPILTPPLAPIPAATEAPAPVTAPAAPATVAAPTPDDPRANTNAGKKAMTSKKKPTLLKKKRK